MTLKEVAKKANTSVATVSYVLNGNYHQVSEETKNRVLKVIQEMNYKPNRIAKSLRTSKTNTIGIIAEDITVFNTPEIINGIGEYSEENGYNIVLNNLRLYHRIGNNYAAVEKFKKEISALVENMTSWETDGIIYVGAHYRDVTGIMTKQNKPVVYTYCFADTECGGWVNFDDEQAMYDAVEFIIGCGHTKIAILCGLSTSIPTHARLKGYQKAMMEHGLTVHPAFVKNGDWEYESGFSRTKELLEGEVVPTAITAMNDVMAIGAVDAAREMGYRVPDDLSVAGFDNREFSGFSRPGLTTVGLPLNEMGKSSAESLLNLIRNNGEAKVVNQKLKCRLVQRASVMRYS